MSTRDKRIEITEGDLIGLIGKRPAGSGNTVLEIIQVFLTPLVIALVSLTITYKININQTENAKLIAQAQIESAENIAEAQREHSREIAGDDIEVQRLQQIDDIFKEIINNKDSDLEAKKILISEFAVYRDTALPFLVKLRDYFSNFGDERLRALSDHARETITIILSNKHLNFRNMIFGSSDERRNLRGGRFKDFDLTNSIFDNCDLYEAKFTNSSLSGASFVNADLYGADFSGARLDGAKFEGAELRKAVFRGSKLDGVSFEGAIHVEDALFTLDSLLKDYGKQNPFAGLSNDTLLNLLAKHIDEIKNMDWNDQKIKRFLTRFEAIVTFEDLISNLRKRHGCFG